jgi:hypothetical protein
VVTVGVGCVVTDAGTGCGLCVAEGEEGKGKTFLKGSNRVGKPLDGPRLVNMSPICVGLEADVFLFGNGFSIEGFFGLVGIGLGLVFGGEWNSFEDKTNDFPPWGGFLWCRGGRCSSPGTVKGVSTWLVSVGEKPERGKWGKSEKGKVLKMVNFICIAGYVFKMVTLCYCPAFWHSCHPVDRWRETRDTAGDRQAEVIPGQISLKFKQNKMVK